MPDPPADQQAVLWAQALASLEREVGDSLYQTLSQLGKFKGIREDDTVVIAFPYQYLARVFTQERASALNIVFSNLLGRPVRTEFTVEASPDQHFTRYASQKRSLIDQRKEQLLGDTPLPSNGQATGVPRPGGLSEAYRFGEFVVREANQLAFAAAKAVAEAPGTAYNPLFLYSQTGLGKTHLLHAIANDTWSRNPGARLGVVSAEDYANELIDAIRNKTTKQFRDKYHALDCLLVDDIHFLINKPNCQEAFLHTFNTFFEAHKQIVVTADRKPRDLTGFQDRLISRLEGGLLAEIQRPAYDTRLAILQRKAEGLGLPVPVEALSTIANLVTTNVRGLEGCLKMLKAQMLVRGGQPLAHEELEKLVLDFLSTTERDAEVMDLNTIMEKIAAHYRVSIPELISKKRTASVAHPRQMVMYFCRQMTSMSLEEIGRGIGGRDHSTVLYACQKIQGRAQVDPTFRREVEFVRSLLTGQRGATAPERPRY